MWLPVMNQELWWQYFALRFQAIRDIEASEAYVSRFGPKIVHLLNLILGEGKNLRRNHILPHLK